jgi:outer membrane protein assembly factor BamB
MPSQQQRMSLKVVGVGVVLCCLIVLLVGIVLIVRAGIQIARTAPPCLTPGPDMPGTVNFQPASGQSGLYVSNDAGLYRLSMQQGQLVPAWLYKMHPCLILPPTVYPDLSGFASPYIVGKAAIAGNMVYFEVQNRDTQQAYLYALHSGSGALAWKVKLSVPADYFRDVSPYFILRARQNMVYVDYAAAVGVSSILSLNASDGSTRWSYQSPSARQLTSGGPVPPDAWLNDVGSQALYLASTDSLVALNASTGKQVWETRVPHTLQVSGARLFDGVLYATANTGCAGCAASSGVVLAYNPATGTQLWQSQTLNGYLGLPSEANGIVYGGSTDGYLHALRASDGAQLWQHNLHDEVAYQPQVINGLVCARTNLFFSEDANTAHTHLICLNAANGSQVWSYAFPVLATPSIRFSDSESNSNIAPLFTNHGLLYAGTTILDNYTIDILQAVSGKLVGTYSVTISGNLYNLALAP